jgi:hypothetical protein
MDWRRHDGQVEEGLNYLKVVNPPWQKWNEAGIEKRVWNALCVATECFQWVAAEWPRDGVAIIIRRAE